MKTIISIGLFIITCVGGCETEKYKDRLLYDSKISDSWGYYSLNDSTIIGYQTFETPDTQWVRFTIDKNNYWKANSVISGYLFGFYRLNLMAQKKYVENLKYVYTGKWAMKRAELINNEP